MAKQTKAGSSPLRHGFLIHDVSRLRRTAMDRLMKPMGITRSQWWVLTNLSRHEGDALTQVELSRLLDVGKVTVGGLIDRLEENGLVERMPDPQDRRVRRITVSAKGRQLVEEMQAVAMEINESSMKGVTHEEQKVLIKVLSRMKENLLALS